jgi:hypothetical protein
MNPFALQTFVNASHFQFAAHFGDAGSDALAAFTDAANAEKDKVQAIDQQLWDALAALQARNTPLNFQVTDDMVAAAQNLVQGWHNVALDWMNQLTGLYAAMQTDTAGGAVSNNTQALFNKWLATGDVLARTGASSAAQVQSDATASALAGWAANFVPGMQASWAAFVAGIRKIVMDGLDLGGDAAKKAAGDTAVTFLMLAGALAAGLWLLGKSGARVNAGPVQFGSAMRGQKKRVNGTLLIRGKLTRRDRRKS